MPQAHETGRTLVWSATVDDLQHVPDNGKAELVDGELVVMSPTGFLPGRAGGNIYASLREYERRTRRGYALPDKVGFLVDLPRRRSFSPDAAFHAGPPTAGKFLNGAPIFAVELRSEGEYGPAAERSLARKRAEYFAAGTAVVWDLDVLRDERVLVYAAGAPESPRVYGRGQRAEAEPALPGWSLPVDDLFE